MKRTLIVLVVFTLAWACSTPQPRTSESLANDDRYVANIESAPPEYQLAYLDNGQLPRGTDTNAARIRYLLKSLSDKTGDPPSRISNRTSACTQVLKQDYGRIIKNQAFLEQASDYFEAGGPKIDYSSLSAMLVVRLGK